VANTLKKTITRSCDLAARYGGEEFVVIMPETTAAGALQVARNILNEIHGLQLPHESSAVAEHDIVTVSIGVGTTIPNADIPGHLLVAMADKALYEAKENGRNRINIASYEKDRRIIVSPEESYGEPVSLFPAQVNSL
jgi:diguanylate cyclase (GGDEF)-like protein